MCQLEKCISKVIGEAEARVRRQAHAHNFFNLRRVKILRSLSGKTPCKRKINARINAAVQKLPRYGSAKLFHSSSGALCTDLREYTRYRAVFSLHIQSHLLLAGEAGVFGWYPRNRPWFVVPPGWDLLIGDLGNPLWRKMFGTKQMKRCGAQRWS